jgi:hypothetical protein
MPLEGLTTEDRVCPFCVVTAPLSESIRAVTWGSVQRSPVLGGVTGAVAPGVEPIMVGRGVVREGVFVTGRVAVGKAREVGVAGG